jgi:hypothetical protein
MYSIRENAFCTWELLQDEKIIATSTHPQPLQVVMERLQHGESGGTWPQPSSRQ